MFIIYDDFVFFCFVYSMACVCRLFGIHIFVVRELPPTHSFSVHVIKGTLLSLPIVLVILFPIYKFLVRHRHHRHRLIKAQTSSGFFSMKLMTLRRPIYPAVQIRITQLCLTTIRKKNENVRIEPTN
jgi:hypothetical protein